ncbi:MAG: ferrous iron transport protein A [Candidatus Margulisiibacteriota bacterium]
MAACLPLVHISAEQSAVISHVEGQDDRCMRLYELGFVPGSQVTLTNRIAFGGPMAFQIRGTKVALRREDAACIYVQPV